jgi:hypothetical protein
MPPDSAIALSVAERSSKREVFHRYEPEGQKLSSGEKISFCPRASIQKPGFLGKILICRCYPHEKPGFSEY